MLGARAEQQPEAWHRPDDAHDRKLPMLTEVQWAEARKALGREPR